MTKEKAEQRLAELKTKLKEINLEISKTSSILKQIDKEKLKNASKVENAKKIVGEDGYMETKKIFILWVNSVYHHGKKRVMNIAVEPKTLLVPIEIFQDDKDNIYLPLIIKAIGGNTIKRLGNIERLLETPQAINAGRNVWHKFGRKDIINWVKEFKEEHGNKKEQS